MKKLKKTIINVVAPIVSVSAIAGCSLTGEAYNLNVIENENGDISVNKESASVGEEVVITANPDYSYALKKILVGEEVCEHDENNVCKYIMTSGNKEIKVEFYKLSEVRVNFNYNDTHVLVDVISENEVYYPGDVVEFKVNVESGYSLYKVKVGDQELTANKDNIYSYTLKDGVASINVDVITLELENYHRLDFITTNHVDVAYDSKLYGIGTTINLNDVFIVDDDYLVDYYVVNGNRINGHSYVVEDDAMIEVVIARKLKVTYIGGNHTSVNNQYEYYKHGDVINLNKFTFEAGYEVDYYLVDGERVSDVNYIIGNEDITVSVKAKIKQFKVTYIGGDHVSTNQTSSHYVKGDVIDLNKFTFEEGYELDYYTIDGERYNGDTYTITDDSITISAVARVETFAITYVSSDHASTSEVIEEQEKGTIIDLDKFTFEEGYELDYYTVNGVRVDISTYTIDDEDIVISIVAKKMSLQVNFQGVENAGEVNASQSYNYGDVITLPVYGDTSSLLFNIKEGYFVDYITINGEEVNVSEYRVTGNVTISIKLIKGTKVTFIDSENASVEEEIMYVIPNNTIELDRYTISEGYHLRHYVVNGVTTKESSYLVTNEDISVSIVVVDKVTVTLLNVENATPYEDDVVREVSVGGSVYLERFYVTNGYIIDHFIINGNEVYSDYYYEVGVDDIVVTPVVVKAVKLTLVEGENYSVNYETIYARPNSSMYIGYFIPDTGYVIDYFIVDGVRIDEEYCEVGTEDIVISAVVKTGIKVTFEAGASTGVREEYANYYVSANERVYLYNVFTLNEGDVIIAYLVNGTTRIEESYYDMGEEPVTISPIVTKGVKVTYVSVQHAESNISVPVYSAPNKEEYLNYYNLDEGYVIEYFLVNGVRHYDNWYDITTEDITIVPVVRKAKIAVSDFLMHGNITLSDSEMKVGNTITITTTPDEGYIYVEGSLMVNGEVITGNTYTITDIDEDIYVWAAFVPSEEQSLKSGVYGLTSEFDVEDNKDYSVENGMYLKTTFIEILSENSAKLGMLVGNDDGLTYQFIDVSYVKNGNIMDVNLIFDGEEMQAKTYFVDSNTLVFNMYGTAMVFKYKEDIGLTAGKYNLPDPETGDILGTLELTLDNKVLASAEQMEETLMGTYQIYGDIMHIKTDYSDMIYIFTKEGEYYLANVITISYDGDISLIENQKWIPNNEE